MYVLTVRGQLVPVDVRTARAFRPIDVGGVSQDLVTTPNGKAAYVLEPPCGVVAVDLATRTALALIKIHNASSFALTPNGKTLYGVGTTMDTTDPVLTAIDTAANTTTATIALHAPLHRRHIWQQTLVMAPDGRTVYASVQAFAAVPCTPRYRCRPFRMAMTSCCPPTAGGSM